MGATLINVTSWTPLGLGNETALTATKQYLINTNRIISIDTRANALNTTGVTDIRYAYKVNGQDYQNTLVVTEAKATLLTAANANVIAT